jgi:hypothetical protein
MSSSALFQKRGAVYLCGLPPVLRENFNHPKYLRVAHSFSESVGPAMGRIIPLLNPLANQFRS